MRLRNSFPAIRRYFIDGPGAEVNKISVPTAERTEEQMEHLRRLLRFIDGMEKAIKRAEEDRRIMLGSYEK